MAKPINPNLDLLPCSKCKGASGAPRRKGKSWCAKCESIYYKDYNEKYGRKKGRKDRTRFKKMELAVIIKALVAIRSTLLIDKFSLPERVAFFTALDRLREKESND